MDAMDARAGALVLVDYQARLLPAIDRAAAAVASAVLLARAARTLGIPVIGTEQNPAGLGPNCEPIRALCPVTLAKTHFDACADGLLDALRDAAPRAGQVVIAGCEAHVCLLQTALGLLRAGKRVWVVASASGSRRAADHAAAMARLAQAGATIVTHEMVLFEWLGDCRQPRFRDVLRLVKAGGADSPASISVTSGYRPGLVGRIAEMHAVFYARHYAFGPFFESQVASGVAEFAGRLNEPGNGIWAAIQDGRIVGSIAIDGQDLGNGQAHLRWFILDDGCRGAGVGRRLMQEAIALCDRCAFAVTRLWTFKGLDAARRLYEDFGFELVEEAPGAQWGSTVLEQQFARAAGAPGPRP